MRKLIIGALTVLFALSAVAGTVTQSTSQLANRLPRERFWDQVNGQDGTSGAIYNITSVDLPAIITELNSRLTTITSSNATLTGTMQAEQVTSTDDGTFGDAVMIGGALTASGAVTFVSTTTHNGDILGDDSTVISNIATLALDTIEGDGTTITVNDNVTFNDNILGDGSSIITNFAQIEATAYVVNDTAGTSATITNTSPGDALTNVLTVVGGIVTAISYL